jgi:hypothetical protein
MALVDLHRYRQDLMKILNKAIRAARSSPWNDEPQLVANLVHFLPTIFNQNMHDLEMGSGVKVQAGGVFMRKPTVIALFLKASSTKRILNWAGGSAFSAKKETSCPLRK